jgi:hypothetical protein
MVISSRMAAAVLSAHRAFCSSLSSNCGGVRSFAARAAKTARAASSSSGSAARGVQLVEGEGSHHPALGAEAIVEGAGLVMVGRRGGSGRLINVPMVQALTAATMIRTIPRGMDVSVSCRR